MPYNFVADSVHTKKPTYFKQSAILLGKRPFCVLSPLWEGRGSGATYNVHLRLIGKPIVDLLLVLIELFCLMLPLRRYTSEH